MRFPEHHWIQQDMRYHGTATPWAATKYKPQIEAAVGFWWEVHWRLDMVREPTQGSLRLISECLGRWDGLLQTGWEEVAFHRKTKSTQMCYTVIRNKSKLLCSFFFIRHNLIAELRRNKAHRSKCMQIQLSATHLRSSSIPHLGFIL